MRLIDADALKKNMEFTCMGIMAGTESYNAPLKEIDNAPTIEPEQNIIRCKDCKWWDKYSDRNGYCHAAKHGYVSKHWEISIYRTYKEDFYCADAEPKEEQECE